MPRQLLVFGRVSVLLLALGTLAANIVRLPRHVPPPPRSSASPDPVVTSEERLAGMREFLRASTEAAVIGYLDNAPSREAGTEQHYLAQFALQPIVLDRDEPSREWLLANFDLSREKGELPPGYRVVRDFGRGVWLLQKTSP